MRYKLSEENYESLWFVLSNYDCQLAGSILTSILCLSYFSKNTAHDQEIQKLYEEMEYQIKQEKERILTEVS